MLFITITIYSRLILDFMLGIRILNLVVLGLDMSLFDCF